MPQRERERWLIHVELPANLHNSGRYMALVLKRLLRSFGVKCIAILDTADATHQSAQERRSGRNMTRPSSADLNDS